MRLNKILITAAICFVAGLVIFTIGFGMVGFDGTKLATEPEYIEKSLESSEPYETIVVNDSNTKIEVVKSEDENVHLSYFENKNKSYDIKEDNNTLTVTSKNNKKWYQQFFNLTFESQRITTIEIPERFCGKLSLQTSNGKILVSDVATTDIKAITSNSGISIENLSTTGTLFAKSSNGGIEILDTVMEGDITCKTSNHKVYVKDTTCANLSIDTSNGAVELTNVEATSKLNIETCNSHISLDVVGVGTGLDCKSSNGDIEGIIMGKMSDFSITSKTSNGRNNLPTNSTEGDKLMKLITSNSDIDITFANWEENEEN